MLQIGGIGSRFRIDEELQGFGSFCQTYRGEDLTAGKPSLVMVTNHNVRVIRHNNHDGIAGVVPLVLEPETVDEGRVLTYTGPTLEPLAEKLADPELPDEDRRGLLMEIAQVVDGLEQGANSFFFPYICPGAFVLQQGVIHLLGGRFDFNFMGEEAPLIDPVERFTDPAYSEYRSTGNHFRPESPDSRARHMRYGVGVMVLEAAYGHKTYIQDEGRDALSKESLPEEWHGAIPFLTKCLGFERWETEDSFLVAAREALRVEGVPNPVLREAEGGSIPLLDEPEVEPVDKPLAPPPRTKAARPLWKVVAVLLVGGLLGLAAGVAYFWTQGVHPLRVGEMRTRWENERIGRLILSWPSLPLGDRSAVTAELRGLDPDNPNLAYLELLENPSTATAGAIDDLEASLPTDGEVAYDDPRRPWFRSGDLRSLRLLSESIHVVPEEVKR